MPWGPPAVTCRSQQQDHAQPAQTVLHALQVYRILLKATACVQPVSCDEAYLDVTGLGDPEDVATSIRQQILEATGCTASAGIGPSMLIARLATKKGKPNGQYRIHLREVCKSVNEGIATKHAASAGCLHNGTSLPFHNNISSGNHLHQ